MPTVRCKAVFTLLFVAVAGCSHHSQYNPYVQPGYANPWDTPRAPASAANPALPPPMAPSAPGVTTVPPTTPPGVVVPNVTAPVPSAGVQGPNWNNPGTLQQQRQQANVFDPFANNEVGPEIVGGRPRDFQKPMSVAVRAQFSSPRNPF